MRLLFLAAAMWAAYRIIEENRPQAAEPIALLPAPKKTPTRGGRMRATE